MSQSALLLITDDKTVLSACQGWIKPLAKPRVKKSTNPFTGEAYETETLVPEELESNLSEPTIEDIRKGLEFQALNQLSNSQPVAVKFTLSSELFDIIEDSPLFLVGDAHGEVHRIRRIEPEKETAVLEHFSHVADPSTQDKVRRSKGLSVFIYIYN